MVIFPFSVFLSTVTSFLLDDEEEPPPEDELPPVYDGSLVSSLESPVLFFVQFTVMVTSLFGIAKLMPLPTISSPFAAQIKSLSLIPSSVRSFNVYPSLLPIWRFTISPAA